MSEECANCAALEREMDWLRSRIDSLEQHNYHLENIVREKDGRVSELEDVLETMRRDLSRVQDGYDLDHARRVGRGAIGGMWG